MARLKRAQNPPLFDDYKKYKPFLREEFNFCCVYCQIREPELGGCKSFHIDHYRPKKKFPDKKSNYSNLFYACRDCNAYKRDYWPTKWQQIKSEFVINPCDYDLDDHIDYSEDEWIGKTRAGKWNIKKLRLNSKIKLKKRNNRRELYEIIKMLETQKSLAKNKLNELHIQSNQSKVNELNSIIQDLSKKITTLKEEIEGKMD